MCSVRIVYRTKVCITCVTKTPKFEFRAKLPRNFPSYNRHFQFARAVTGTYILREDYTTSPRHTMASGASTPDYPSAEYHAYTEPTETRPNHGPPAYPGNPTDVNSVRIAVEPSDEGENGTNGEVSIPVCNS